MTARLAHITRHPIKSVGYEDIDNAPLTEGRVLPFDRVWAISHHAAKFDGPLTGWASKLNFVRGAAAPGLMAVQAKRLPGGKLELTHPDLPPLTIDPDLPADQRQLLAWLRPLWPESRPSPRAVERVSDVALTDVAEPCLSLLSLASLADLGAAAGASLSRHRFRCNLAIDGWAPWAERDLPGKRLRIGGAELAVAQPITRCRATCGNPETGMDDFAMLDALMARTGDKTFGVYATVVRTGHIATGDRVEIL